MCIFYQKYCTIVVEGLVAGSLGYFFFFFYWFSIFLTFLNFHDIFCSPRSWLSPASTNWFMRYAIIFVLTLKSIYRTIRNDLFILLLFFENIKLCLNINIYLYILTEDILHIPNCFLKWWKYHNLNTYVQISFTLPHILNSYHIVPQFNHVIVNGRKWITYKL